MKKVLLSLSVLVLSLLSCNKDDSSSESSSVNQDLANSQNATEEAAIPLAVLESGVKIEGANKINGQAPPVNSDLTFTLESNEQEAFQDSGLDIKFSAFGNISGAYIQFKDVDGNASGNYFDVPVSAFNNEPSSRKSLNSGKSSHKSAKIIAQEIAFEQSSVINIDFENVPAGQFCYDICLYDANQNVYVIQEVCVEVEAWGGNASIVGSWEFSRFGDTEENRDDFVIIDENGNFTNEIECASGGTVTFDSSNQDEEVWSFNLNDDGTYFETYIGADVSLNFTETVETCALVFEEPIAVSERYSGNWAFNEDDNTLTVVDFRFENLISNETDEYPDGELYFEGVTAAVISGELRLEDEDGDVVYFKRK